jgi:hypothetical protein
MTLLDDKLNVVVALRNEDHPGYTGGKNATLFHLHQLGGSSAACNYARNATAKCDRTSTGNGTDFLSVREQKLMVGLKWNVGSFYGVGGR